MKRWIWTVAIIMTLSTFMVGCGDDKKDNNNNNNDQYGYYDPYTGRYHDSRYPNNNMTVNRDAVLLSGKIEITDGDAYRKYLKGIGACLSFWSKTCEWVDNAPGMTIQVDDYKFRGFQTQYTVSNTKNTSRGTVLLHTQSGPTQYSVEWRLFDGGTGFSTQQTQPYGTPGYNKYINVKVTGRSTDSTVLVELMYNNKSFGYGYLQRINR